MGAQWKREKVQDHKFDFINVDDFVDNSCWLQFTYMLVFAAIIRGILIYCSDIFTAVNLMTSHNINGTLFGNAGKDGIVLAGHVNLHLDVYKYLFTGCIVLGFLLLALEIRRANAIIKSRDISHAFTSMIASRYYTVRSYAHYCFFAQINNSKKSVDEVAFFCFFKFRNWKRLILADAPRQVINATLLYQTFRGRFYFVKDNSTKGGILDWDSILADVDPDQRLFKQIALGAMIFTVFMFAISLLMLLSAVVMYIPLVSHIQGNLKEYCCHKIDKRIDELIRKKSKTRATEQAGKAGKGDIALGNIKQPTLPQLDLLEAPPAATPRNDYSQGAYTPHQNHRQAYNNQQDYGYSPASHSTQPLVQNQAYNQYAPDEYFQTPSSKSTKPDPYVDSAYTTDDVYDAYGGTQEPVYGGTQEPVYGGQQQPRGYYNNASTPGGQTPSRPVRRHDDYPQRPGSPMQSQHGSDLDSHHSSSGPGGYGGSNSGYGNNNARYGGGNYGHGYQPSPRRQETGPRDRYGGGTGGGRGGY